jgi:D-3-phosphoglycerate dehydrogenase
MKILLYESFENIKNFYQLKKKVKLVKIDSKERIKKNEVKYIFTKFTKFLSKEYLLQYQNLSYIFTPTTGLNHIDLDYCKKKKIKIHSLRNKKKQIKRISSTTELNLALILTAIRKLCYFYRSKNHKISSRYIYDFYQFKNYSVGIIGYGRIGSSLFKLLKKLKFKVFFYDEKKIFKRNKNFLTLDKLLKTSDIVSLNMNYNNNNYNFMNLKKFKKCKKDVTLINTSRGEIINEENLITFLKKEKKASAYLDVIKNEQIKKNKKLLLYARLNKNLFLTPHIGGATKDALLFTEDVILEELFKVLKSNKNKID